MTTTTPLPPRPLAVSFDDVARAATVLDGHAHRTPVLTSRTANAIAGAELFFKCENLQRGGAFKFRGAYNAISRLSEDERRRGVIAFSSGNHAQAMALAGRLLGARVTIVMPEDAPAMKLAATRGYGATVITYDRHVQDREGVAAEIVAQQGLTLIPPYDHPDVIAGQGTAALELIDAVGPLDALVVCVGGGGLLSGCAIAAAARAPGIAIYGVEPEAGNDGQRSFRSGEIVHIGVPDTIADGARTQHVGTLVLPILRALVRDIVTVTDDQLRSQMRFFAERMKIVVEPTGCLAAAAVMQHAIDGLRGKRVGIIVTGGNVDPVTFCECVTNAAPLVPAER